MTERNDPPPLHTALEIERLRARLDAQDARIEELRGLLRPFDAKRDRAGRITVGACRLGAPLVSALAIATLALAILLGVMSWPQIRHLARAADDTLRLTALPGRAKASQQQSDDNRPQAKRTSAVSVEPMQFRERPWRLAPAEARATCDRAPLSRRSTA
ncbi:MAG: hypothetical protein J2P47_03380 [Acetobacteraceae bacterium]|nr:hypothetical protein [Acetobacteraceae bacterium]